MSKFAMRALMICATLALPVAAYAGTVTVTNNSSEGWVQISPNTFGLPADLTSIGCGSENEPSCEPEGVFDFNVSFLFSGTFNIFDSSDSTVLSDQISFFNDPVTELGVVTFLSDPGLANATPFGTTLCDESASSGCVAPITILTSTGAKIVINVASDGEQLFDPFGLGADSSDEIQFTSGVTVGNTPEPSSVLLLVTGFAGLLGFGWRRVMS